MTELEELSKKELLELINAMKNNDEEKAYQPDSIIAMAMADPKEARAIAWRMKHPVSRVFLCVFLFAFFLVLCLIVFVVLFAL